MFFSHRNGNLVSIYNTCIFVSSFVIFNNKWNQEIFHCVPLDFCSAFHTSISGNAPLSLKTWLLRCLPFDTPPYLQLTQLRDVVQTQCKTEEVLLCDDRFGNRNLCKPIESQTMLIYFKCIMVKARGQGQQSDHNHVFFLFIMYTQSILTLIKKSFIIT